MITVALLICINNAAINSKTVMMEVSAYCTCWRCCGHNAKGITASGERAKGKIIAAPKKYAFGTIMKVPNWGTGVVMDRGGAIKAKGHRVPYVKIGHRKVPPTVCKYDRIDLLFETHQEALEWGRKIIPVTIIAEK